MEAAPVVQYSVSFPEPHTHYMDVDMKIDVNQEQVIEVKMPVWAPGSYLVREFARNVEGFTATAAGKPLEVIKTDKNTWRINTNKANSVNVKYKVYAFELTVRTSFVDASHAYINGSSVFMYVEGLKDVPCSVRINLPLNWQRISTGLDYDKVDRSNFLAANYDILVDSPFEIGNQDLIEFYAAGIPHVIAMYGKGNYSKETLIKDVTKIVEEEVKIFGEHPCKRYVFIVHNVANGGGGLEHLNSTTLQTNRFCYSDESSYRSFLSLVAHEYFHLWNVKRLRPEPLGPFNYGEENYTEMLWIAEGFTAYYDELILQRTKQTSTDKFLEIVSGNISNLETTPGNQVQSVSESSFDAWIKYYRRNENSRNSTISYYDKGALVGLMLDISIASVTNGQKSLDDVMRLMYDRHYKKNNKGYTEADFRTALKEVSGQDFSSFLEKYVHGTGSLDYANTFASAGINYVQKNNDSKDPYLGVNNSSANGKIVITGVVKGGPAWTYGLNVNDEVIAINNYRVEDLSKGLSQSKIGDKIKVLISRDGVLQTVEVTLSGNPNSKYKLEKMANPSDAQKAVLAKWLR